MLLHAPSLRLSMSISLDASRKRPINDARAATAQGNSAQLPPQATKALSGNTRRKVIQPDVLLNDAPCWGNYSSAYNTGTRFTCRLITVATAIPASGGPTRQCCCINTDHAAVRSAVAADDWSAALCHARKHAAGTTPREALLRGHAVICLPAIIIAGAQKAGSTAISAHLLANDAFLPACAGTHGRPCAKELHFFSNYGLRQSRTAAFVRYAGMFSDVLSAMAVDDASLAHVPHEVCANIQVSRAPVGVDMLGPARTPQVIEALSEPMFGGGGQLEPPAVIAEHIDESDTSTSVWRLLSKHAYASSFLHSHFTADATPAYMLSSTAMRSAADLLPHAHVIITLREPVARAYSEYNMKLRRVHAQAAITNATAFSQHVWPFLTACGEASGRVDTVRACVMDVVMSHASLLAVARTRPQHDDPFAFQATEAPRLPAGMRRGSAPTLPAFVSVINCWTLILLRPSPLARDAFRCMYAEDSTSTLLPGIVAREQVNDFEQATLTERANIEACSVSCTSTQECMQLRDETGTCWPRGGIADISHDYLYRSVYATHMLKVLRAYPRERVHVIGSRALRRGDVNSIRAWMPVQDDGAPRVMSAAEVDALIRSRYGLLIQEGWQASSSYPPMQPEVDNELHAWIAPYNEALFEVLGYRLAEGDW